MFPVKGVSRWTDSVSADWTGEGDIPGASASAQSFLCIFRQVTCHAPGIVSSHQINKTRSQSLWLNLFPSVSNNMAGRGHYQNLAPDPSWALIPIATGMTLGVGSKLLCGMESCHQSFFFVTVSSGMTAKCSVLLQMLLCLHLSSCMGMSHSTSGPGLQAQGWQVVFWHLAEPKALPMSFLFPFIQRDALKFKWLHFSHFISSFLWAPVAGILHVTPLVGCF